MAEKVRESGFYCVKFRTFHSTPVVWEVAKWFLAGEAWTRVASLAAVVDDVNVLEVGPRVYLPDDPLPEATPPAEQPVTLEEVQRVLEALSIECQERNYTFRMTPGWDFSIAGGPTLVRIGGCGQLRSKIRAALANLDAPPKPSTLDVMRGVE